MTNSKRFMRRDIRIPAELMKVASIQPEPARRQASKDSFPIPISTGTTAYAENLRCYADRVCPTAKPRLLLTTPFEPCFTETRGNDTNFFTIDKTNTLRQVLTLRKTRDSSETIPLAKVVATLPAPVKDSAVCSSFTVLLLANGETHYLDYDSRTGHYSYLGPFPSLPDFEAVAVEQPARAADVGALQFDKPVADFRGGIDEKISSELAGRMKEALDEVQDNAHADGLFTAAVALRVAMRLWDGRLVSLSPPKLVGVDYNSAADYSMDFPLLTSDKGFTGTAATRLSIRAFRLEIKGLGTGSTLIPEGWAHLVRRLEVWVSGQAYDLRAGCPATMHFRQADTSAAPALHGAFLMSDTANRPEWLLKASMRHLGNLSPTPGEVVTILREETSIPTPPGENAERLADFSAEAIASHDGFLHLANITRTLPPPAIPAVKSDLLPLRCRVAVTVNTNRGPREVVSYGYLPGGIAAGLLHYPDTRATRMTIGVWDASSAYYERHFFLTHGENPATGAWYVSPHAREIEIVRGNPVTPPAGSDNPATLTVSEHLHEMVLTCHRGNPFAVADAFDSTGDEVVALGPQTIGGGAFTRQYIYVFTRSGISAINHDLYGRYTNLRSMSAAKIDSASQFVPTPRGLALLAEGELLLLSDHRVAHLLRGLSEYSRLMWDARRHELWLVPPADAPGDARSLCLDFDSFDDVGARGSMRTVTPHKILRSRGETFYAAPFGLSWSIYLTEGSEDDVQQAKWISMPLPITFRGFGLLSSRVAAGPHGEVCMSLHTRNIMGRLVFPPDLADGELSDDNDLLIVRAKSKRSASGASEVSFCFPSHRYIGGDHFRFYVSIEGDISSLSDATLFEQPFR